MQVAVAIVTLTSIPALANDGQSPAETETDDSTAQIDEPSEGGVSAPRAPETKTPAGEPLSQIQLKPYVSIVGGLEVETIQHRTDLADDREDRIVTLALSRFGLRGTLGEGVYVESELEINAGPHGTSVWEGQAALQVRNQMVRVERGHVTALAGRITDPTSVDFYSAHIADQLLTDSLARYPLLASGLNRGNGLALRYEIVDGLTTSLAFTAGNPTATTGSLMIGGTFPPFSRFYEVPWEHVGRDGASLPQDNFHIMLLAPSVAFTSKHVDSQASVQLFRANTNTNSTQDAPIDGYNVRAGARLHLATDHVRPFVNASRVTNPMVDPNDLQRLSGEMYVGTTASAGVDFVLGRGVPDRSAASGAALPGRGEGLAKALPEKNIKNENGFGLQYAFVNEDQASQGLVTRHYANLGGTYWLGTHTSVGARVGMYTRCERGVCDKGGERSFFLTMRLVL